MTKYNDLFFNYVDSGAIRSAEVVTGLLVSLLRPASVLDVGCGRGGWLRQWKAAGCPAVLGIDGAYVDTEKLLIDRDEFRAVDLNRSFDLGERFSIVTCLEVGEHIQPSRAEGLVGDLVRHGDTVLFSAAVPGQGGTQHINERPLEFWRSLFAEHGFAPYDAVRPRTYRNRAIEPWYRFNSLLYVAASASDTLDPIIRATRVPDGERLREYASLLWLARRAILRPLPVGVIDHLARINARYHITRAE
jgi:SAM-dependent methyltransferase